MVDTIKVPENEIDRHYCQFTSNRGIELRRDPQKVAAILICPKSYILL